MEIKLNVGKIAFPIAFDNGKKDVIYFNPNDPDLSTRLMNTQKSIDEQLDKLMAAADDIKIDGSVAVPGSIDEYCNLTEEQLKKLDGNVAAMTNMNAQTRKLICDEIDRAFGNEISNVLFKYCSPLAIVNGKYFVTQFLDAIVPAIRAEMNKANSEIEKQTEKHVAKYRKYKGR